ncbi:MAG TPA: hypothetical protein VFD06_02920 [Candidatus Polarisedimenticolia bacterium]|nr:hypothetical protein [Candidatus Polarisedimenticolia bacterium]
MKRPPTEDLYERLERELRTPAERLLLDAFLPAPSSIPSALARPPAPEPIPGAEAGLLGADRATARDREVEEPAPRRRPRPRKSAEPQRSLEEEIADFMNQRGTALAPDTDPEK